MKHASAITNANYTGLLLSSYISVPLILPDLISTFHNSGSSSLIIALHYSLGDFESNALQISSKTFSLSIFPRTSLPLMKTAGN